MANNVKKKVFLLVFCLASIVQGMYSTYFVSILTTIERIYQIQSKTAGAIIGATEIGQILGSLLIAYYGGKGNKPKWMAACMTITALAALISTSPHFLLMNTSMTKTATSDTTLLAAPYLTSDLTSTSTSSSVGNINTNDSSASLAPSTSTQQMVLPTQEQLCYLNNAEPLVMNSSSSARPLMLLSSTINTNHNHNSSYRKGPVGSILVIFFLSLLAIGFGSTAITTLGIPFIDDIVSKEESPLYLGLTIGLRIFGPALGFLLGSFCIGLDVDSLAQTNTGGSGGVGAWWLGLVIISLPLLILALPMYFLSLSQTKPCLDPRLDDFEDITYRAAEDHDIGGSTDFQPHVLTIGDLDVTSNGTCYSEVDSSSHEVLQQAGSRRQKSGSARHQYHFIGNFGKNLALEQPMITKKSILNSKIDNKEDMDEVDNWPTSCLIVNHFGGLESTSFTNDEAKSLHSSYPPSPSTTSSSSSSSTTTATITRTTKQSSSSTAAATTTTTTTSTTTTTTMNLSGSLSRLIKNRLLLLRMLSGILHILPIAGFFTFLPKYLIEQFGIAPSSASAISGLAGILFVGLGAFLGGTIIRLLNVNSRLMTRWIAMSALLYALGMLILMNLGCPQNQTIYYESSSYMSTDCLTTCNCHSSIYSPVCANGTTYLSPCLAGCKSYTISEGKILFDECGCSQWNHGDDDDHDHNNRHHHHDNHDKPGPAKAELSLNLNVATQGHCLVNCDNLIWYIIIFSFFTLIHASCEVGSMMFNLRCVRSNDRTLALGLITFSSSLLGTIPCSVIYGTVVDLTCIHWDTVVAPSDVGSKSNGACLAYKNDSFRYYLHGVTALVMFLAFLVDCIISRRAKEVDFYDKDDSKSDQASIGLKKSTETI